MAVTYTRTSKYAELEEKLGGSLRETDMLDTDYKDPKHPVYWLEFYGARCPICGGAKWCMVNVTGTKVICQKIANDHPIAATGGYLYSLDGSYKVSFDQSKQKPVMTHPKASPQTLDLFYRAVLQGYPLSSKHREDLHKRGLSDEMISLHGERGFGTYYEKKKDKDGNKVPYFTQVQLSDISMDTGQFKINSLWNNFISNLKEATNNPKFTKNYWFGVPGFYNETFSLKNNVKKAPVFAPSVGGMLVPFYNEDNQLIAFQTRVDHVKETAEVDKSPLNVELRVDFNSCNRHYTVYMKTPNRKQSDLKIADGVVPVGEDHVELDYGGNPYSFDIVKGGKYFWVSSAKKLDGTKSKSPVSVVYNPAIARLNPTTVNPETGEHDELNQIRTYANKPKAIWLTEGSLKAQIATDFLDKRFEQNELDRVGRDFLAVGGVSQYKHFLPMLKKLHVTSVTTAYDMDFQTNEQVKKNYRKLIDMLSENGFKIRLANWDLSQAKGIDEALVQGIDIDFREI